MRRNSVETSRARSCHRYESLKPRCVVPASIGTFLLHVTGIYEGIAKRAQLHPVVVKMILVNFNAAAAHHRVCRALAVRVAAGGNLEELIMSICKRWIIYDPSRERRIKGSKKRAYKYVAKFRS